MLFALLALTMTQTPEPVPVPTPEAPPAAAEAPPPPSEAPAPSVPAVEPLRPEEIPPDAKPPAPAAMPQPNGFDGFTTGLTQAGIGTGIAGVFSAGIQVMRIFIAVPGVDVLLNVVSCINCAIVPGAIGVLETAVGDATGKRRGAALWPVLAAYGGCCVLGTAQVVAALIFSGTLINDIVQGQDPNAAAEALAKSPALQVTNLVFAIIGPVLIGVSPALAYAFTAEDKKPGDPGGFGMPGILSPNHAGPMSTVPSTSGTTVMRF